MHISSLAMHTIINIKHIKLIQKLEIIVRVIGIWIRSYGQIGKETGTTSEENKSRQRASYNPDRDIILRFFSTLTTIFNGGKKLLDKRQNLRESSIS